MKKALPKRRRSHRIADCTQKTLLPLFAVGGSLAAAPAHAIELGEATVQSQLGQPLRASIAFALAPTERLAESCISLGAGQSGLPGIGRATISIADGALLLKGSTPVREPLVATNVVINCPFAAKLSREYMMFIDPAGTAANASPAAEAVPAARPAPAPVSMPVTTTEPATPTRSAPAASPVTPVATTPTRRATPANSRQPIGKSTRYRVQRGDSLSEITQRIENRRMGLWAAVNVIFEANPEAFLDNDPNKLKAGSLLTIPSFDGREPVVAATAPAAVTEAAPRPATTSDFVPSAAAQPEFATIVADETLIADEESPEAGQAPATTNDATADLQPGAPDVVPDSALTEVPVAATETIAIPDTALPPPQSNSATPNVATATAQARSEQRTSSWLWWLGGSGAAIILALLLFGRTLRGRFGSTPYDIADELPMRDSAVADDSLAIKAGMDYDIDDDEPTAENPALDADLVMGTGLNAGNDAGGTADVGFPTPTEVDIELPLGADDAAPMVEISAQPAASRSDATILESEILPESDDYPDVDDFDMSVVLDATKMPGLDSATETGLEADALESGLEPTVEEPRIGATETDLTILEQDYEDELSATMALKSELTQAAERLVQDMEFGDDDGDGDDDSVDRDLTAAMSLGSLSDHDVVANPADADNDDNAATIEELTLEFLGDEETVEMPKVDEDKTRKMPKRGIKLDKKAG